MPQEIFIPTEGVSTHLEARNVINSNANDAEVRISNLESRLDLEPHNINSSYGEGETFYFGGSSYRVDDGATLNVGESPTTNPEKVTLLNSASGYATSFNGPHSLGDDRNPSASLGTVTVDVGLSYQVGDYIIVSMVPRPDSFDIAKVTAYDSATGVMSFDNISQSTVDSESTDWNINLTGKPASDVIYSTSFNGPHSITEDRNQANAGNGLGPVTVGTGLSYIGGELIIVSGDPLPENYQIAQVVSYDSDTGVMEWDHIESSTIYSNSQNWNINLTGKIGPAGADGDSAYEVAVSEGFVGTEAAWLASLVGADGAAGQGVPAGGTTGQALVKIDGTDYNTQWATSGGGPSGTTLSGTTANATPTEIFVDGTSPNRVDVATGSTITFSALVAARSATESAGYKIEGVIKNDAGTAALVGVVAKTVFAEEDTAWDITVTAVNNALTFIVTGDSADSVSWEVTLNKTEAT